MQTDRVLYSPGDEDCCHRVTLPQFSFLAIESQSLALQFQFSSVQCLGRVKTSEYLLSLGIIHSESEAMCTFCSRELESLDHLLLHCDPVWRCWAAILRWCGVSWATLASIVILFQWWSDVLGPNSFGCSLVNLECQKSQGV